MIRAITIAAAAGALVAIAAWHHAQLRCTDAVALIQDCRNGQ